MFGAEYVSALNNTSMLSVRSGQIDKSNQSKLLQYFFHFLPIPGFLREVTV